jgi:hypothetical protein
MTPQTRTPFFLTTLACAIVALASMARVLAVTLAANG